MQLREDVAVVIVTHNLQQAYRVADYVGLHVPRRPGRVRRRQEGLRQARRGPDEGVHQRWLRLAPIWPLGAVALVFAGRAVLSGCATTQDANKRASIQADRTLASRKALELRGTDRDVQVVRDHRSSTARTARRRRRAPQPRLPVRSTICRSRSAPRAASPVNARPNVPYFQSHAPAIAPGVEATWVYVTKDPDRLEPGLRSRRSAAAPKPATTAGQVSELDAGGSPGDGARAFRPRSPTTPASPSTTSTSTRSPARGAA